MRRTFLTLFIAAMLCLPVISQAASVSGTVTMSFDLSGHGDGAAKLWIPYPISDRHQVVTGIRIHGNYTHCAVYTDQVHQTPMLYAFWDAGQKERKLVFRFHVKRNEVIRRDFPTKEAAWDPADFAPYLAPTRFAPIDSGPIKALAEKITKGRTTILAKAKAIYDWTCKNTYRDPETRGCGQGNVCMLLKKPGGKCADISSVYVALARAAGVPARDLFGLRLGKTKGQDITGSYHCWAQFYLPGYGWVPVDPADVRKMMLVHHLTLSNAETAYYRSYFWGGIDPYRVRLSSGRDLVLNPPQEGAPLNYLMYPFAQVGGKTLDWLDPKSFAYKITYTPD